MKIAFLGDIAFFGKYSCENENIYDYLSSIADYLKQFDHVVGNLETPLYNGNRTFGYKSAYIKSREENVKLLKYLNIDIVNLANNHIYDYGLEGLKRTISLLEKNGIGFFGVNNIQHKLIDDSQNNKLVFSGYCCYSTNGVGYLTYDRLHGVNVLNAFKVENNMKENHEKGYFNILSIHAGEEHVHYPNYDHVLMARKFASKVPYVYYGHHPHVIQGIENVHSALIAYSLGNFCFDDIMFDHTTDIFIKQQVVNKKSYILELELKYNKVKDYNIVPLYLSREAESEENNEIFKEIKEFSIFLKNDQKTYKEYRNNHIKRYLSDRKNIRNLRWYIKRLKYKYFILMLKSIKNISNYKKNISRYNLSNGNES